MLLKDIIDKAEHIGVPSRRLKTFNEQECLLMSFNGNDHILYIPDNIEELNTNREIENSCIFTEQLKELDGMLKVVGGKHLKSAYMLFAYTNFTSIDISELLSEHLTSTEKMFNHCQASEVKFNESLNTSELTNIEKMFSHSKIVKANLKNFDISKVTNMSESFLRVDISNFDLPKFNAKELKSCNRIFWGSKAGKLDLLELNLQEATNINEMFNLIQCDTIEMDFKHIDDSTPVKSLFANSEIGELIIHNFELTSDLTLKDIFMNSNIKRITLINSNAYSEKLIREQLSLGSTIIQARRSL